MAWNPCVKSLTGPDAKFHVICSTSGYTIGVKAISRARTETGSNTHGLKTHPVPKHKTKGIWVFHECPHLCLLGCVFGMMLLCCKSRSKPGRHLPAREQGTKGDAARENVAPASIPTHCPRKQEWNSWMDPGGAEWSKKCDKNHEMGERKAEVVKNMTEPATGLRKLQRNYKSKY